MSKLDGSCFFPIFSGVIIYALVIFFFLRIEDTDEGRKENGSLFFFKNRSDLIDLGV